MSETLAKFVPRTIPWAENSLRGLLEHQKKTQGVLSFRFPPEPNGYLHIGHAKSMNLNFGIVKKLAQEGIKATCYLRFDDTNPEKESVEFTENILETVKWLGWEPDQVTYSSDYFKEIYECAEKLILKGLAYVDFSSAEEISQQKANRSASNCGQMTASCKSDCRQVTASPYRDQATVEENLELFRQMKDGKYLPGKAVLRLKIDLTSPNPNLWDPVAYRIKSEPHHRTGEQWCLYPTYDFTHCLVDSFEEIDYSLCTLEFENRRELYYWILDQLDLYKPIVWEFSRLNLEGVSLSKRHIQEAISRGEYDSWSDPRLYTLAGLRRRGVPPEVINQFCESIGLTRSENHLELAQFENVLRDYLNTHCVRRFGILEPLEVEITNFYDTDSTSSSRILEAKNHPLNPELGTRPFPFDHHIIYLERASFRPEANKKYYGLTMKQPLGLKYGPNLVYESHECDQSGHVIRLRCQVDWGKKEKAKSHVHWLVHGHTKPVRFLQLDQSEHLGLVESALDLENDRSVYQFERVGYYKLDQDQVSKDHTIHRLIETIGLKSSY